MSSSSSSSTTTTTRPVPRRESPWGRPEGDTRHPKAHRCNDPAEDFVQACFEGNPFKTVPGPFKLFYRCMRSKPGVTLSLEISIKLKIPKLRVTVEIT
ncbi:hypothetical protein MKW98_020348 [Papaver atlanticum]|uniref:Uncharacterized protein n=1 Tax=Papaver atlanticum TaxID=357466 RepID=A0AAD4RVI2_9MAGN|nr:hypothetical protein MKW98_020348 [Papaver atlanticum]